MPKCPEKLITLFHSPSGFLMLRLKVTAPTVSIGLTIDCIAKPVGLQSTVLHYLLYMLSLIYGSQYQCLLIYLPPTEQTTTTLFMSYNIKMVDVPNTETMHAHHQVPSLFIT